MLDYKFDGKNKFVLKSISFKNIDISKEEALKKIEENIILIQKLQDKLYAQAEESLLIIFQAMDASGKDGAIKHVMSGLNPQGVDVYSFKAPSLEELSHDYLWRCSKVLPSKGKISIFNRSYYEDVLIGKVHKLYEKQKFPKRCLDKDVIKQRYIQIKNFEKYLWENGTRVVKIFLNITKEEQKKRFLERIDDETKNWKFSDSDLKERAYWDEYMDAYEDCVNNTSTLNCPWYVIPSNKKWYARYIISKIVVDILEEINPSYPKLPKENIAILEDCKKMLIGEE